MNICHHMLTSSTQLQNRSFHVVERTRTSSKCQKMKTARAKRAKILFFIVKYANLWGFCCRRRRGCLSSLLAHHCQNTDTWTSLREVSKRIAPILLNLSFCLRLIHFPIRFYPEMLRKTKNYNNTRMSAILHKG